MFQEAKTVSTIKRLSELEVSVEGFSGPLDLLCCLVENREVEISLIKISEIVGIYGAFLSGSGRAPLDVIADFISATAGLILEKVLSLLPGYFQESPEKQTEREISEEELRVILERYLPYRNAARHLLILKSERDLLFSPEHEEESPLYTLGDLFSLSSLWWDLLEKKAVKSSINTGKRSLRLEGMPVPVPDEKQVETRISELIVLIERVKDVNLRRVMGSQSDIPRFVVTLLALLELSRLGKISLQQEEMFGDVRIICSEKLDRN